jgi:hypothetical protein
LAAPVKNGIPSARDPGFVLVTDEHGVTIGTIVTIDGSHFAFDVDGHLIGEFPTRKRAIQALPLRGTRP